MQQSAATRDSRYQAGIAHLQSGEWQEAIDCLQELAAQYPDNVRIQASIEEARSRAGLDKDGHYRRWRLIERWRPMAIRLVLVLALAAGAVFGVQFVNDQVRPVLENMAAKWRQERTIKEGNDYLLGGEWDKARVKFEAVLLEEPGQPDAVQGLSEVDAEQSLEERYIAAKDLLLLKHYEEARLMFEEIEQEEPGYGDVNLLIAEIDTQLAKDILYTEGVADDEAGRALEAVEKFELLRETDRLYEREDVESRLADLYTLLGQGLVDADPPEAEALPRAIAYFKQALELRPKHVLAAEGREYAQWFLEGQATFHDGLWDDAIVRLLPLFELSPDYHNQNIADMLYEAHWRSGDEHLAAENIGYACGQYQNAAALPVDDTNLARGRIATACSTPTPSPTATPPPQPKVLCGENRAGVRSGPGTEYARLGYLPEGCEVVTTGISAGWFQVDYEGRAGWVSAAIVTVVDGGYVPKITPGPPPVRPTPLPTPIPPTATPNPGEWRGLVVNAYRLERHGPFGSGGDIWFNFSITNSTNGTISYTALGTWVEETGQFQKSWTYSSLGPGAVLRHRDHINIVGQGEYSLYLAIQFSDGFGVRLSGPIHVVVQ